MSGETVVRVVARVAEHVGVGVAVEALEELVRDRLLDEQARAGEAHLPGVVVLAGGLGGGGLDVGVGEDDQRALAAQLGGEGHDVGGGGLADQRARSRASR